MGRRGEINHAGCPCQVVAADRRTAPLIGYTWDHFVDVRLLFFRTPPPPPSETDGL